MHSTLLRISISNTPPTASLIFPVYTLYEPNSNHLKNPSALPSVTPSAKRTCPPCLGGFQGHDSLSVTHSSFFLPPKITNPTLMKPNLPLSLCLLLTAELGWRNIPRCANRFTISNIPWLCSVVPHFPTSPPPQPEDYSPFLLLNFQLFLALAHSQLITLLSLLHEKTVVRRRLPPANPVRSTHLPAFVPSPHLPPVMSGLFAKPLPRPWRPAPLTSSKAL